MSKTDETHAISTRTRPLKKFANSATSDGYNYCACDCQHSMGELSTLWGFLKWKLVLLNWHFGGALNDYFLMSVFVTTYERSQIIEDKIKTTTLSWRNLLRKSKRNQQVRAAETHAPRARASRRRFPWSTKKISKKICKRVAGIKRKVGRSPMRF